MKFLIILILVLSLATVNIAYASMNPLDANPHIPSLCKISNTTHTLRCTGIEDTFNMVGTDGNKVLLNNATKTITIKGAGNCTATTFQNYNVPNRDLNTVYQNTGGKTIMVVITLLTQVTISTDEAAGDFKIDPVNNPPTIPVDSYDITGFTGPPATFLFTVTGLVPPGYFYELDDAGSSGPGLVLLSQWIEYQNPSCGTGTSTFSGTYNQTQANGVTINTNGHILNFINGTGNPVHVVNSANGPDITISSTGGSSGSTFDTMQNLTPAQAYIFALNNTNTNFQFRGINATGSAHISNSSDIVTIHADIFQNNTGFNLGTSGTGVYSGMSSDILQFLKLISANNFLNISPNSTNVIFNIPSMVTHIIAGSGITVNQTNGNVLISSTASGNVTINGHTGNIFTNVANTTLSNLWDAVQDFGGKNDLRTIFDDTGITVRNPAHTFTTTLMGAAVTANRTLTLPLTSGTLCTTNQTGTCGPSSNPHLLGMGTGTFLNGTQLNSTTMQVKSVASNPTLTITSNSTTVLFNDTGTTPDASFYHRKNSWYSQSNYVIPSLIQTSITAATVANNTIAYPMLIGKGFTTSQMLFVISTANANNKCMTGIYDDNGTLYPNNLLISSADHALGSTGFQTDTIAFTFKSNSIYWLAFNCKGSASGNAGYQGIAATTLNNILGFNGTSSTTTPLGQTILGWQLRSVLHGAGFSLPNPFTSGAVYYQGANNGVTGGPSAVMYISFKDG